MDDPDDTLSDPPLPAPPVRPQRTRFPDKTEESASDDAESEPFDADRDLPGAVLMVPNQDWGFEVVSATDHPGACTHHQTAANRAYLVKGTDAEHIRNPRGYFFVDSDTLSGLKKRTAFELVPRRFRLRRLKLFFPERCLGRLDDATLQSLRSVLVRLYPEVAS